MANISPSHFRCVYKSNECNELHKSAQLLSQAGVKAFIINSLRGLLDHEIKRKSRRERAHVKRSVPACASNSALSLIISTQDTNRPLLDYMPRR